MFSSIIWVFSGIIIPLPFFPDWMQKVFNVLPFRGMMDIPFRIYIGNISSAKALASIGTQLIWIVLMVLLGQALLKRGLKRVVVQGG